MGSVYLGHTHEYGALLSRPPIRRQANSAFFRGYRDLLGQGRGLEGDVLSCASHGTCGEIFVRILRQHGPSAHAYGFRHTRIYCLTHRPFWTAPASQTPNARGVPDQVRSIRARANPRRPMAQLIGDTGP